MKLRTGLKGIDRRTNRLVTHRYQNRLDLRCGFNVSNRGLSKKETSFKSIDNIVVKIVALLLLLSIILLAS